LRPRWRICRIGKTALIFFASASSAIRGILADHARRRVRKISNAHIFEPIVARDVTRHRLLDEILSFFGGRAQPMMAQLAEAGKLTLEEVRELEKAIKKAERNMESK
jgi:hypothetical protein